MDWRAAMIALALCGLEGSALAQPDVPPGCQGQRERGRFESGRAPGRSAVREAASEARCEHMDEVAERVLRRARRLRAPRGAGADRGALCQHAGNIAGTLEELHGIWAACGAQCCEEGELIAEITGQLYCDLSIALGGVGATDYLPRAPQASCGEAFQACCDARFQAFTQGYIDPEGASCRGYTEGAFSSAWDQARSNQCSYD